MSCHFENLFFRDIFQWQKPKSPLILENAWEQRMFTTAWKIKVLYIKNTPGYIQYADAQKKSPFYENASFSQDLGLFFFGYIFFFIGCPNILSYDFIKIGTFLPSFYFQVFFPEFFSFDFSSLDSVNLELPKKRNLKLRTLVQVTFGLGLQKIGTFLPKFLFSETFFPETSFPVTSCARRVTFSYAYSPFKR